MAASVPISAMGMATTGTSVERKWPRKAATTAATISTASTRLQSTSLMAPRMNTASSDTTLTRTSRCWALMRATAARTPSEIATLLDCAWRTTPRLTTGLSLRRT